MTSKFEQPFYLDVKCTDSRDTYFSGGVEVGALDYYLDFNSLDMYYRVLLNHLCGGWKLIEFVWREPDSKRVKYRILEWKINTGCGVIHHGLLRTNTKNGESWASIMSQRFESGDEIRLNEASKIFSSSDFAQRMFPQGVFASSYAANYHYLPRVISILMGVDGVRSFCNELDKRFALYPHQTSHQTPRDIDLCRFIIEDEASISDVVEMMLPKREYGVDGKVKLSF